MDQRVINCLSEERERMRERSKFIGEPAIQIPSDALLVGSDPLQIHMRMDRLIEIIAAIK